MAVGDVKSVANWSESIPQLQDKFHSCFYDPSTGILCEKLLFLSLTWLKGGYADDSQAANVLAMACGGVPRGLKSSVMQHIVTNIQVQGGHLTTGIVSTSEIFNVLTENGEVNF